MKPKISVIVPVYNLEKEIRKCLLSLSLQKFSDFEVIVVDDGSTDNSLSKVNETTKKDPRFLVFHTANHGLSAARNFGIRKAHGDFLAFVDGDDFVDPEFLELLYNAAISNNSDIAVCGYTEFYKDRVQLFQPKEETITGEEATIRLLTRQNNLEILTWNKLYKKSLFRRVSFPVGRICEDNLTTYKLLAKAKKVSYIKAAIYSYVRRDNSISLTMDDLERCRIREEVAEDVIKNFDGKTKEAGLQAKLLAYFKFIDHSLSKRIPKKYFEAYRKKILKEKLKFLNCELVDSRRKKYIKLISCFDGRFYKLYRKIKHD